MRLIAYLLLSCASTLAVAGKLPDNLQPMEPPPPFEASSPDENIEDAPEITIIKRTGQSVEEFRVGGRLYMIKVTPAEGASYYLIDEKGDGKFSRQESLDSGVRPPQWLLFNF